MSIFEPINRFAAGRQPEDLVGIDLSGVRDLDGEDVVQLEKVVLDVEDGLNYRDCNWEASGSAKPMLHPGEVEQVCFVVAEDGAETGVEVTPDGRIIFGSLGIGWRGEMGNRGFLATGKLGTRRAAR